MPIDYSKWDNLEASSSEEEDNNEFAPPRVTRLDAPSKVTFGGDVAAAASVSVAPSQIPSKEALSPPPPPSAAPSITAFQGQPEALPSWIEHGGLLETNPNNSSDDQSSKPRKLYWAQDRSAVTLRLELGNGEKVKSVVVEGILSYGDRWSAVGTNKPKLLCRASSGAILLGGELPHPVHLAEEDSDDGIVDWSVEHSSSSSTSTNHIRLLTLTLHKAVPMQGLSLWWRRPLMDFPEADLDSVRGSGSSSSGKGAASTTSKEFLEAWEEAHKIFREGKQKRAGTG